MTEQLLVLHEGAPYLELATELVGDGDVTKLYDNTEVIGLQFCWEMLECMLAIPVTDDMTMRLIYIRKALEKMGLEYSEIHDPRDDMPGMKYYGFTLMCGDKQAGIAFRFGQPYLVYRLQNGPPDDWSCKGIVTQVITLAEFLSGTAGFTLFAKGKDQVFSDFRVRYTDGSQSVTANGEPFAVYGGDANKRFFDLLGVIRASQVAQSCVSEIIELYQIIFGRFGLRSLGVHGGHILFTDDADSILVGCYQNDSPLVLRFYSQEDEELVTVKAVPLLLLFLLDLHQAACVFGSCLVDEKLLASLDLDEEVEVNFDDEQTIIDDLQTQLDKQKAETTYWRELYEVLKRGYDTLSAGLDELARDN